MHLNGRTFTGILDYHRYPTVSHAFQGAFGGVESARYEGVIEGLSLLLGYGMMSIKLLHFLHMLLVGYPLLYQCCSSCFFCAIDESDSLRSFSDWNLALWIQIDLR